MGPRPKAVFFCNFPPPYTGQTIGTELTCELLDEAFEITRVNTSDGKINLARTGASRLRRARDLMRTSGALVRHLRSEPTDVLYVVLSSSTPGHFRDAMVLARARPHVGRVVVHIRSGNFHELLARSWHAPLTRRLVRQVDAFIFLSEGLKRRSLPWIPESKCHVVANPIDRPLRLSDAEVEAKLDGHRGRHEVRAVFVGNLIRSKGYMDLLRAVDPGEGSTHQPIRLDFVGAWIDPADRREFEAFVRERGLDASVHMHGPIADRSRIKQILVDADALVLPTYYPVEAQPRSIIEAMNAATPVISTRHASIPDYVFDGVNGYLIDPHSPQQIRRALLRLSDESVWQDTARAARETYRSHFAPEIAREGLRAAMSGHRVGS